MTRVQDTFPSSYNSYAWVARIDPRKAWLQGRSYLFAKRIMDLVIVLLAMPFALPLMGLIVLLIKLDSPGAPAIFNQQRTGKGGKPFRLYKFRTMVPNAEEMKKQLMHLNELQWPDFKITNDPRITRVGKFLKPV
jgi:lipopolysaccharide/colanic/teichoic acid biosynthesis glycosyltransferase